MLRGERKMDVILALLPILAILVMLLVFKKSADVSGLVGWVVVCVVALAGFSTSIEVVARSTVAGLIKSFSISIMVAVSLLQMAFMEKTGALKRITVFIKTVANGHKAIQILLINIGFGSLMVAVGATPVSILPPIMLAMGYSTGAAILLPAIGYNSLCTYALLGAPIVVFVDMANKFVGGGTITLSQVGVAFTPMLAIITVLIGFCMLWYVDKWQGVKKGWLPCLLSGVAVGAVSLVSNRIDNLVPLTGFLCGLAVIAVLALFLKLTGHKFIDKSILTEEEKKCEKQLPLWKAFMPWILLIVLVLFLNLNKDIFNTLYYKWLFPIKGVSADGSGIATRFLWNAYTWVLVSTILSIPFLKPTKQQLKDTMKAFGKRAPRPVLAAAIYFAIGEVMNMSGFNMLSNASPELPKFLHSSMIKVLADASVQLFQSVYGFFVSFIGLISGFLTGSATSAIGMFGNYTMTTAKGLGLDIIAITAALTFGAGLASMISPAKLQNASASIDKIGEENKVIRVAFVFSIILTLVSSAIAAIIVL